MFHLFSSLASVNTAYEELGLSSLKRFVFLLHQKIQIQSLIHLGLLLILYLVR